MVLALPPRSSVLLPGAGNEAEKAVQPKEKRAKNGEHYDVDEAGLRQGHLHAAAVTGDDDRDVTTILPVDQAHVRLRGGSRTAFAVWFGRVYEATIDCATADWPPKVLPVLADLRTQRLTDVTRRSERTLC